MLVINVNKFAISATRSSGIMSERFIPPKKLLKKPIDLMT